VTIREWGTRLRNRQISCVELMQQTIAAIKSGDKFNSIITTTYDQALLTAAERDNELAAGHDRGPFHGIPIAHKDLLYTRGVKTTGGSLIYKHFVPDTDAVVVTKLHDAGAISIGKTNLHELAYGITSNNPHYGPVLNPHDTARIPGGSSGGSAALVSAGLLPMASGTDTGGSIRIPAAYCGITGIKPTYGLVSKKGVLPLSYGLDHIGPLGSNVEDCALALQVMADNSSDFNLPALPNLSGVRIGVPRHFFFDRIDSEVETAIRTRIDHFRQLGAIVGEVDLPDFNGVTAAARIVQMAEAGALYIDYHDSTMFGKDVWANILQGREILGHEYVNAQRLRTLYRQQFDQIWRTIDVIVSPTTPITAPLLTETTVQIKGQAEDVRLASTRLVRAWNFLGEPALSLPCGKDSRGLPIGMQLVSAPFGDARLLQIAKTMEHAGA
jgi:aspartyl-tRNA(Asn)/glutamyl-tRNA(Gln) amidotransferase subunit A